MAVGDTFYEYSDSEDYVHSKRYFPDWFSVDFFLYIVDCHKVEEEYIQYIQREQQYISVSSM